MLNGMCGTQLGACCMGQGVEPAVSVIIPTYNRAGYVRQCLRSLRACGLAGLEVIVADDGSTDDTEQVVAAHPEAKFGRCTDTGSPSIPRNRGFELSRARYVAFLDCDDAWLPSVPARAVGLLDRYPMVDVLFADANMGNPADGYTSWIEMGGQAAFFDLPCRRPEADFRILERVPFFRRMAERNPVFIGAVIMRREVFAASGGFDPRLRGAADWELVAADGFEPDISATSTGRWPFTRATRQHVQRTRGYESGILQDPGMHTDNVQRSRPRRAGLGKGPPAPSPVRLRLPSLRPQGLRTGPPPLRPADPNLRFRGPGGGLLASTPCPFGLVGGVRRLKHSMFGRRRP